MAAADSTTGGRWRRTQQPGGSSVSGSSVGGGYGSASGGLPFPAATGPQDVESIDGSIFAASGSEDFHFYAPTMPVAQAPPPKPPPKRPPPKAAPARPPKAPPPPMQPKPLEGPDANSTAPARGSMPPPSLQASEEEQDPWARVKQLEATIKAKEDKIQELKTALQDEQSYSRELEEQLNGWQERYLPTAEADAAEEAEQVAGGDTGSTVESGPPSSTEAKASATQQAGPGEAEEWQEVTRRPRPRPAGAPRSAGPDLAVWPDGLTIQDLQQKNTPEAIQLMENMCVHMQLRYEVPYKQLWMDIEKLDDALQLVKVAVKRSEPAAGRPNPYATIAFATMNSRELFMKRKASDALAGDLCHYAFLDLTERYVHRARRGKQPTPAATVRFKNFCQEPLTAEELWELGSWFGEVEAVKVIFYWDAEMSRRRAAPPTPIVFHGTVEFKDASAATRLLAHRQNRRWSDDKDYLAIKGQKFWIAFDPWLHPSARA